MLEIDGASNRGIDEIRQLRQNVNVRPSRARFKIYIIDEVHMLTREAFNALLKTLEEPPEHVKFIFCTTEADEDPDHDPLALPAVRFCRHSDAARSPSGCGRSSTAEGVEAEPEALEVLARRAAGSMRDSQSLLEQLLAFAPGRDHRGRRPRACWARPATQRLAALVEHLVERDAAGGIGRAGRGAGTKGSTSASCSSSSSATSATAWRRRSAARPRRFSTRRRPARRKWSTAGKRLGLETMLAIMQILDQTLSRMRYSTQGRILAELALVRICQLEDLDELAELIAQLRSGASRRAGAVAASDAGSRGRLVTPPARPAGRRRQKKKLSRPA